MCVTGDCEACTRAHEFERANEEITSHLDELKEVVRMAPAPRSLDYTNPEQFNGIYSEWYDRAQRALED